MPHLNRLFMRWLLVSSIVNSALFSAMTCAESLRVLASEYPPYVFTQHNGELAGFAVDLFQRAKAAEQWDVKVELMPWPRVLKYLKTQPGVLVLHVARTSSREDIANWSRPYSEGKMQIFALETREDIHGRTLRELTTYSVATYRQGAPLSFLGDLGFHPNRLQSAGSPKQLLELLLRGRVDLVADFEQGFITNHFRNKSGSTEVASITSVVDTQIPFSMAINKLSAPHYLEAVNKVIAKLDDTNKLQALEQLWRDAIVKHQ